MKAAAKKFKTIEVDGKQRYYEPAPKGISAANFKKVVESRRSVRKFTDKPIPKEVLDECLDMALLAPCSSGLQPWEFYVVKTPAKKAKLVTACLGQLAAKSAALACENLVLAFRAHGFDTCMMEGYDEARVRKLLKLNDDAFPIMVIGAGERADDGVFWPQIRFERELFVHEV